MIPELCCADELVSRDLTMQTIRNLIPRRRGLEWLCPLKLEDEEALRVYKAALEHQGYEVIKIFTADTGRPSCTECLSGNDYGYYDAYPTWRP